MRVFDFAADLPAIARRSGVADGAQISPQRAQRFLDTLLFTETSKSKEHIALRVEGCQQQYNFNGNIKTVMTVQSVLLAKGDSDFMFSGVSAENKKLNKSSASSASLR
jgi:hypothetical protein